MNQKTRGLWKTGALALALASTAALMAAGAARADTLVIINNAAFGNGPIETVNATTHTFVNQFIPDAAKIDSNNGRAVAVLGNFVYYTELQNGFGPSDGIHVALFNNGAGSADIHAPFANPVPGTGIVDLAEANGLLYAMTGYPNGPEVVQATDGNGNNVGPVITLHDLAGGNLTSSDGFTVLPNGNWLINTGDLTNVYNQFNPLTGNEIAGTTINAHTTGNVLCGSATGVDNDGTSLYFTCNFNQIVQTTFAGVFIAATPMRNSGSEDISIVGAPPINPPLPEPATLSLMSLALLGLWRRKRSA